jgi:cellulose synthase/poly-beta-1,6-N-acetylglucosamine synthase-like glycosyltransferase
LQIILYIFIAAALIQWVYWALVFGRFAFFKQEDKPLVPDAWQPVSVIICARNEAVNLQRYLPEILQQDYENYEVIVVNDNSSDYTGDVLGKLQKQYKRLIVVNHFPAEKKLMGKRDALLQGIGRASHEWLVFTDADCCPASRQWLQYLVKPLSEGKEIVAGYSPYAYHNTFLNAMIRYETYFTAVQYCSLALVGMPYMAVGRNMAYTRSLFQKSRNFYSNKAPLSGDDDLLVNELANEHNVAMVTDARSVMLSDAFSTWQAWITQKIRHYGAGHHYKPEHRLVLGIFYISWLAFYILAALLLFFHTHKWFIAAVVFLSLLYKLLISRMLMQRFRCTDLWIYQPLFDFLLPLFLFTLGTLSLIQQSQWKNRQTTNRQASEHK